MGSECCLDIMEGVWKEYQMCLGSTCKVSGSCKKDFLSQKLTNVKKKGLFGPKNQAGAELMNKKRIFGPKNLTNKKKKKKITFFGQKNKLGLSLSRRRKKILGNKIDQFKKKGLFKPKNKLWLSLRTKKDFFGQKL